ncbi:ribosome maturation factor RimP [Corynebacterium lowii]|uniref:Ribosome maturation factor RimP n=1 Tax=Corynebacterium lowii TaxID=1544413 RepID=A0A0Q0YW49_9CORY|nr:ribosome maturation factor RimP [Corynebacterium lowii]KQB86600.1 Ribosome maturation factor RimP [Corynebacterium lowii]MDP9851284.1 ribosome maturation factor RimP [Corynebacterium lowii]
MPFPSAEQITDLARSIVEAHGHPIEGVRINRAGKKSLVGVMVDADSDTLEAISGELSALFDAAEAAGDLNFGPGYTLEVSTPGVDTPLTAPRHWKRNRNRMVEVKVGDETLTGRIGALSEDENAVILVRKEGKTLRVEELRLEQELTAVVQIEFAQPPVEQTALTGMTFEEATQWQEENK